jgi:hypothetical protein
MVLPFENMSETWGINVSLRCPFTNRIHVTGEVEKDAAKILTGKLVDRLVQVPGLQMIPLTQGLEMQSDMLPEASKRVNAPIRIQEAGKRVGADAALIGRIYRYRERLGRAFSAERPASVNFDLVLVRISDRQVLWYGNYDETQAALADNLFQLNTFIKRRAKWLKAEDLAAFGLEKLLDSFQKNP